MKIVVAVKRVIHHQTIIQIDSTQKAIDTANVKMSMNPFDEIAIEEAIRLKEKGLASEVITVSVGPLATQEILRTSLAMGADRALLVQTDQTLPPLTLAKIFYKIAQTEKPALFLLGKQAIDSDNNQTGQMLAGLLAWPQGTFISKLSIEPPYAIVEREIDGGAETLKLQLPAVITTDLRLNEPRYISLPNIMQAKKKTIDIKPFEEYALPATSNISVLQISSPPKRKSGIQVKNVQELIAHLKKLAYPL